MSEIDAYYHCYKQRKSLNFVLENFRKTYPTSTIKLISDGGLDYSIEAQRYKCDYEYKENIKSIKNQMYERPEYLYEWCKRFFSSIIHFNNPFFIMLEDDVYVIKKININDLLYDINGINFETRFPSNIVENISRYNKSINNLNLSWGGCGGSIYKTFFFKNIYLDLNDLKSDVYEYCSLCNQYMWANDIFLSYLCYKYSGTLGNYSGFCETWHSDCEHRLKLNNVEVLHKYKNYYE